ncbi:TolC family protein [Ichthyenterobacterium sp. W332]|uniref:TolC family protein n=1 Tax=Microcosmobacter mediterraneus TaxID=3075607 RepID=A0ABU2YKV6_9FLAO|nr:TolC family protein [Ichthyenterobacterium sp. W332]MDT0557875.1 TolC family protein [Ichthyenterobacterium sp. W332]
MRKQILLSITLLLSFSLFAQDNKQSFSLQEAIDYALQNNRTAKNAARDIEAAVEQKWETTSTGLPQLNATVDYQNQIKQQFEAIDFDMDGVPDFGARHSMTASANLTQKVFDGSYLVGLQSAKVFLEISKNAKEKTDLEVRKAVIEAYGNVLLAEESVQIFERNISVLQKNLDETTKIFENGLGEEESVEQLQITLSGVQSNLNNTKRLKTIAYQMFNITIGQDINTTPTLTDNLMGLAEYNIVLSLLDAKEDYENTIDYKIAENDKRSKELLLKLEKSKALPTLDAFLNGSYIANRNAFDFADFSNRWIGTATFGASLRIPIFSSLGRSAATQRARINLEKAQDDLLETEQKLLLQIKSAKSNYQFAIEDYNIKKDNLALAERIEQKNQIKFFEGIASSFELSQAQTQLYGAQQDYLQAMVNVINNKAELETILNQIPKN